MSKLLLLLLGLAVFVVADPHAIYNGAQLLRLNLKTVEQLEATQALETLYNEIDFWLEISLKRPTDIYVPSSYLNEIKSYLQQHEISYQISIPDVGGLISEQMSSMSTNQEGEMNWDDYQGYDTIMKYVDDLAMTYPDLATVETYGTSTLGRELKIIKIGRSSTEKKPAFFFDGGMHAREWIGPAIVTFFMQELLVNQTENQDILDGMDIYITPIANPDGYEYTRSDVRLWRKTRSTNEGATCIGTDPNRNFEFHWGGDGTSPNKCSDIFKGSAPFSEPETRGMSEFVIQKRDEGVNWVSYFAMHSYAQMWLVPWGWTYDLPPTYDDLMAFGNVGAEALTAVHGTQYAVGSVTELLTPGAGGSDDYFYGSGLFRYSQTVEVRDEGRFGFLLPKEQIIPCAEETFAAIQAVARYVINNP